MKILLTVHQFFPDFTSGTEVLTFSVAKEFIRRGHEVWVLTGFPARKPLADKDKFDAYDIEGIHVFRFHHAYQALGNQTVITEIEYNNQFVADYFCRIIEEINPDLIHFFHLSRLGAGLIDVAAAKGVPAFYTPTDFWSVCPTSQLLLDNGKVCRGPSRAGGNCVKHVAALTRGAFVKKFIRFVPQVAADLATNLACTGLGAFHPISREVAAMSKRRAFNISKLNTLQTIFSPTRLMTDVLLRNGVSPKLIQQTAFGIDVSDYGNHERQRGVSPLTFGFIGTLSPHKGCHVLIQAFKRLDTSKLRLKIYGSPNDFPEYFASLVALAGDDKSITFCGTFPNSKVASVINEFDALVVPSLWYENTPLVVYSAHAAKCPVVASDYPGMSEIVLHHKNGLVFPPGNISELSVCLQLLVDDSGLLEKFSHGCKTPKSTSEYADELETAYLLRRSATAS